MQKEEQEKRLIKQRQQDIRMFQQELLASADRPAGSNPKICLVGRDDEVLQRYGQASARLVVFSFSGNAHPLRTSLSGKFSYIPILLDEVRKKLEPMPCNAGHEMRDTMDPYYHRGRCNLCKRWEAPVRSSMLTHRAHRASMLCQMFKHASAA